VGDALRLSQPRQFSRRSPVHLGFVEDIMAAREEAGACAALSPLTRRPDRTTAGSDPIAFSTVLGSISTPRDLTFGSQKLPPFPRPVRRSRGSPRAYTADRPPVARRLSRPLRRAFEYYGGSVPIQAADRGRLLLQGIPQLRE
jgi:hypothetical protein